MMETAETAETAENDVKEPMKFRFQESNESYSGSD